jgi:hypothetical protein
MVTIAALQESMALIIMGALLVLKVTMLIVATMVVKQEVRMSMMRIMAA